MSENPAVWKIWARVNLHEDSKTIAMSLDLKMDPELVAYKLLRVWAWAVFHTDNGVTKALRDCRWIDRYVGIVGFADAMRKVGWIVTTETELVFPNFGEHNPQRVYSQSPEARRQREYRQRLRNGSVTKRNVVRDNVCDNVRNGDVTKHNQDKDKENGEKNLSIPLSCPEAENAASRTAEIPFPDRLKPILTFPCRGKPDHWHLTGDQLAIWERLYDPMDVLAVCRKALAWILASPDRKKTARGMPRYLVNFLGNEVGRGRPTAQPARQGETTEERIKRIGGEI